jgi:catechol 2,3-dioxygenase-like lactoylglutathione lyase family enzyme
MITALDHIALAVHDFDVSTEAYQALIGRGAERTAPAGGARRAWFHLDNLSLEIIAPEGEGPAGDRVRAHLAQQGEGLLALAFRVADLAGAQKLCERRGLATTPLAGAALNGVGLDSEATGLPMALVEASARPNSLPTGEAEASLSGLDHVVVLSPHPDRALALYGAKLGLDLRLDRTNTAWGARQIFFRCGGCVVEIGHSLKDGISDAPDRFGGLAWRTRDPEAARERLAQAGFNVSEVRKGRKPGTKVFTVRDRTFGVPTLVLSATTD